MAPQSSCGLLWIASIKGDLASGSALRAPVEGAREGGFIVEAPNIVNRIPRLTAHASGVSRSPRSRSKSSKRRLVTISEEGWRPTAAGLKASYGNCQGWMQMLCALKANIEHGINLRDGMFK